MGCDECNGICLTSAYYGTARYGLSFYGLIMPISHTIDYSYVAYTALTYGNEGAITIEFDEY